MLTSTQRTPNKPEHPFSRKTLGLIGNLAMREVKSQYNRTVLGRLWSLLNPLATIAVFSVIFGVIFNGRSHEGTVSGLNSFPLWIAIGVLTWGFIAGSIAGGMGSLVSNTALLSKVYFPRYVLVISAIISAIIQFIGELFVIMIVMSIATKSFTVFLTIPALMVLTVVTSAFTLGIALILSVAVIYFRDVQHLWNIFTQVWMYASGVVFPVSMLADVQNRLFLEGWQLDGKPLPLVRIFQLNPAQQFLEAYRALLYDFTLPSLSVSLTCLAWAIVMLALGSWVFARHSGRIVEEL